MTIAIVAIDKNFAIGRDGKLPWHYGADLKFFKKTTVGNIVVMGASTWRSIHKPLPDRLNIVLTRSDDLKLPPDVERMSDIRDVINLATTSDKDVFIIGGAKTYAAFANVIDKWIVTDVPMSVEDADTFMPLDFLKDFVLEKTCDLGDGLTVRWLKRVPRMHE